jgi:predicted ATP-dependent Lon-type protease
MTTTPASSGEMDHLDQLGAKAFDGFLVRKDLVRKYSRQPREMRDDTAFQDRIHAYAPGWDFPS